MKKKISKKYESFLFIYKYISIKKTNFQYFPLFFKFVIFPLPASTLSKFTQALPSIMDCNFFIKNLKKENLLH